MKTCLKCLEAKEDTDFGKHKKRKDGLQAWCKACTNEHHARRREEDRKNRPGKRVAGEGMKICPKCGVEKLTTEFSNHKLKKDGLQATCKACLLGARRIWCKNNAETLKEKRAEYWIANRDRLRDLRKKRNYYSRDKEGFKKRQKRWNAAHKDQVRSARKMYIRNKRSTDPLFLAASRIRARIGLAFARGGYKKRSRSFELIGCSMEDLLIKFGVHQIPRGYHIDHIVPMAQAKTIEEVEKLCHHRNLQLLIAADNITKSDSKTDENAALCLELLGREWID